VKRNQSSRLGKDKQHEDQVKVKTKMYPSKKKIKNLKQVSLSYYSVVEKAVCGPKY